MDGKTRKERRMDRLINRWMDGETVGWLDGWLMEE